ncbi:hypothetical protein PUMCH_001499 [Australozyma saopauloensis]|uniref:Domain of unknown function at the cortex 1 domain-containing protein n=1 Tax=Australozyma saopauloensis TaxID=291208 RepID=A0AAX4H6Z9_9ASCO|nr:hypothetical protein PUMCH_001499 [[Candida] saopauloensis]
MTKRLYILAGSTHEDEKTTIPINTGNFVDIDSKIGLFSVIIDIVNFDSSEPHKENSAYNRSTNGLDESLAPKTPNLRILAKFTPSHNIPGTELLFGNDGLVSITKNVPTSLISTGLRFFKWFMNPTINSDMYGDMPYLYGYALNSFTKLGSEDLIGVDEFLTLKEERFLTDESIPTDPSKRQSYFCKVKNCEKFEFQKGETYFLMFETSFISIGDSKYHVKIPTFGDKTIDVDVLRFSDENLNNFNWTVKQGGMDGVLEGEYGLVINFGVVDEDD